jgi:hypothetical protein
MRALTAQATTQKPVVLQAFGFYNNQRTSDCCAKQYIYKALRTIVI